ncbi:MAG: LUD domain-containing protein [Lunatimonas sp.]|uniref:LutC/YkgG family protein n=1 Tax=Lunatimonas sp. TaxID=2060141 RepID=UPI00263AA1B7|nr:LUD domain-containing protein [Lunatimonas sp.]MCC5935684.1 LUD domain-containing protein [Lunatimonas sp.]
MSSREQILAAAKANKPAPTQLPDHLSFESPSQEVLFERFQEASRLNGGKTIRIKSRAEISSYLREHTEKGLQVVSTVSEVSSTVDLSTISDPHDLEAVELAVLEGTWSAAENAAIWMPEENLVHRVLPFIAQHLAVVISSSYLLGDMHAVYEKVQVNSPGYGVFIAGPSKTADIEQSLVIGAHGPRSMTVFLVHED